MSDYNDGILPEPCLRMDTHFGDEYESIEFGDGTGYIKAVPILAKVGALHEEIDRLRDESAELRELCGLMFVRLNTLVDDRWCPVFPGDEMTPYDVFDRYDELVQMGIEVDV